MEFIVARFCRVGTDCMSAAGIRHTDFVTQYPSQFTTVQSFDRDLIRELTERISGEHAAKGVNVELGPVR